jgi:hypothetical protein
MIRAITLEEALGLVPEVTMESTKLFKYGDGKGSKIEVLMYYVSEDHGYIKFDNPPIPSGGLPAHVHVFRKGHETAHGESFNITGLKPENEHGLLDYVHNNGAGPNTSKTRELFFEWIKGPIIDMKKVEKSFISDPDKDKHYPNVVDNWTWMQYLWLFYEIQANKTINSSNRKTKFI